jgi:hypothetical protein
MNDKQIEQLWNEFDDITMIENENKTLCLLSGWNNFDAGTDINTIWEWFNINHSKGIQYLMYELED